MNFIGKLMGKNKTQEEKLLNIHGGTVYSNSLYDTNNCISAQECLTQNRAFIYICTKLVSQNCSTVPLRLYSSKKKNEKDIGNFEYKSISSSTFNYLSKSKVSQLRQSVEVVEVLDHPILDLLYQPNLDTNYNDNFTLTYNYLDLCGSSYWYVERDTSGTPISIFQLRPDKIEVIPDSSTGLIKGYLYNNRTMAFSRNEVIRFNYVNPENKWIGLGIIEAMSAAVKRNNIADQYEAGRLANNARPDFVVAYKQTLTNEQMKELDNSWNRVMNGPSNAGKVKIMGSEFDVKPLSMTPQEMQYLEGRKVNQKEISAAFGIPYSMIDMQDQKRAGLDQTEKLFQKNAVVPRLDLVESTLNEQLIPMYDQTGSLFLAFDNPVKEDEQFNLRLEESRIKNNIITIDEVRQQAGLEPLTKESNI